MSKLVSDQYHLKQIWFVFDLFQIYCSHFSYTKKKHSNQFLKYKLFWPDIHFKLQILILI